MIPVKNPVIMIEDDQEIAKYVKKNIPKALKEQSWLKHIGPKFKSKCPIVWCQNTITCFDYHTAHIIPECKNGPTTLDNLIPTCSKCNLSMGNKTVTEWNLLITRDENVMKRFLNKLKMVCRVLCY